MELFYPYPHFSQANGVADDSEHQRGVATIGFNFLPLKCDSSTKTHFYYIHRILEKIWTHNQKQNRIPISNDQSRRIGDGSYLHYLIHKGTISKKKNPTRSW